LGLRLRDLLPHMVHLVDARRPLSRAVFGEVRSGTHMLAGSDPFALDHCGCRLIGIDPATVKHLDATGPYEVEGARPGASPFTGAGPRRPLHCLLYRVAYFVDALKCRALGGGSILPTLHWHLGVHPGVGSAAHEELERLAEICPVGAIDVAHGRIVKKKCMGVRCLKCYHASSGGGIVLKGLNAPEDTAEHERD
jgi:hypothetical protein